MRELPSGTVTFLLTDIEGSTKLWEEQREAMSQVLVRHDSLLTSSIERHEGAVIRARGEGDSFFAVFARATDAVATACAVQRALVAKRWSTETPIRVRIAIHTGEAELREGDYYGSAINRCARLRAIAHGRQTILSLATEELVRDALPEGASLRDLGEHRLRDLARPERVYQLLHPDLAGNFPALKSLDTLPNNLPHQLTSFIGREKEMAEVKQLLSTTFLLTLTGSGGCGKTRLALQVAADALDEYPDGVWVVELATLTEPALIPQSVAATFGVREEAGHPSPLVGDGSPGNPARASSDRSLLQKLLNYLQLKKLLLILDNCEHLLAASAHFADTLLRACPNLRILATSREGLGITGEVTWRVSSLSLPDLQNPPSIENLTQYEAVRLFIERAVSALPTFKVTNQNAPAVAQICHRLDGIPLAIELAAVRVKSLPVEQIATRLYDRFRLLTGGSRTALPRQQTLRAAMDWSYGLLMEQERVLLGRLSVFAGGWTLEAAEQVCSGESIEAQAVLDLLTHLVDKSLVVFDQEDGEGRYRMLETVRQYSRDKLLEAEESAGIRQRHLNFFLKLAEQAEPELKGAEQLSWLKRLELEHDNLRSALEWSFTSEEAASPLQMAGALWRFWYARGHWREGRQWLDKVLSKGSESSLGVRAKVLYGAGVLATNLRDDKRAATLYAASLASFRELEDQQGIAMSLLGLGDVAFSQNDFPRSTELYEEGLTLCRSTGDNWATAIALIRLGSSAEYPSANYKRAAALYEESLTLFRAAGDTLGICDALSGLGWNAFYRGDYKRAQALLEETLAVSRPLGNKSQIELSTFCLGWIALGQDDHRQATSRIEEALAMRRELGNKERIGTAYRGLGFVALNQGNYERAREQFMEWLKLSQDIEDKSMEVNALCDLAEVEKRQGHHQQGQALLEDGLIVAQSSGAKFPISWVLESLGETARYEGNYERAIKFFEEALALCQELGYKWSTPAALGQLGVVARCQADYERAKRLLEESLAMCQELEVKWSRAWSLGELGIVARHQGDYKRAIDRLRESWFLYKEIGNKRGLALCLERFAGIACAQGQTTSAAHLFGAAGALREATGTPLHPCDRPEYERDVTAVRTGLSEEAFTAAWAQGRAMTLEQAVEYALEETANG